jgi:mono/diheme cytochrome c family protein
MRTLAAPRRGKLAPRLAGVALAAVLLVAGFVAVYYADSATQSGGYDPALRYPARADVILLQPPPETPTDATPVGNLAVTLAGYARVPGARVAQPETLDRPTREALAAELVALFGTPAAPRVPDGSPLGDIAMTPEALATGARAYRRQCNQCHGLDGGGQGNAGEWMHPFPRDFRRGLFKVATHGGKPRPDELRRVLREGVPGTRMQAYDLVPDAELNDLIGYVIHLSQRGETELRAVVELTADEADPADAAGLARDLAEAVATDWHAAANAPPLKPVTLPAGDDVLRHGQALFAQNCLACHAGYGREESFRYDAWGVAVRVTDLTKGEWKWGKSPELAVARVRNGIPAANMPANPNLTDAETRDLAAFLLAMSRPDLLPEDVREAVYPDASE